MLLATGPTKPREPVRTPITEPTMPISIWNRNSTPKVFSHLRWTSTRLLDKLSKAPTCSIIITGTTKENIIAIIIPGIINATSPMAIRMPVMTLVTKSGSNRDRVKLKLDMRVGSLFSSVSEVNFTAIPWVMLPIIQPTIPDRNAIVRTAERKPHHQFKRSCSDAVDDNTAGTVIADSSATKTTPSRAPAIMKGSKN
jgi:hypothetical protein